MNLEALPEELRHRAQLIRLLICDVDGVLTDGRLFFTPDGQEFKGFHARDGHGLKLLQRYGVDGAVISGRNSPAVELRMSSLGIRHVYQGREDKLPPYRELLDRLGLKPEQTAFIGDDILDLPLMHRVGLAVAVADAHFTIREAAHWTTSLPGGQGAVRELCDLILITQGHMRGLIESYS